MNKTILVALSSIATITLATTTDSTVPKSTLPSERKKLIETANELNVSFSLNEMLQVSLQVAEEYQVKKNALNKYDLSSVHNSKDEMTNQLTFTSGRKMSPLRMSNVLTVLMVPALMLAGIMPWVMPPLKMAVMFAAMINNMAFSSALFSLIRNYIFNSKTEEHIIYVNNGYKNKGPKFAGKPALLRPAYNDYKKHIEYKNSALRLGSGKIDGDGR